MRKEKEKVFSCSEEALSFFGLGQTKLEKLANSFYGFMHAIEPSLENSELGSISLESRSMYKSIIKKEEVKKKVLEVYDEKSYIPIVIEKKYGFKIIIMNNPFRNTSSISR